SVSAGPPAPIFPNPQALDCGTPVLLSDLNGDGRADIGWLTGFFVQVPPPPRGAWLLISWLINADGSVTAVNTFGGNGFPANLEHFNGASQFADFNCDGFADIMPVNFLTQTGMSFLLFGNGDGTMRQVATSNTAVNGYKPRLGDLNADGKTDVLWDQ